MLGWAVWGVRDAYALDIRANRGLMHRNLFINTPSHRYIDSFLIVAETWWWPLQAETCSFIVGIQHFSKQVLLIDYTFLPLISIYLLETTNILVQPTDKKTDSASNATYGHAQDFVGEGRVATMQPTNISTVHSLTTHYPGSLIFLICV